MMSYEEFKEAIKEAVEKQLGPDVRVEFEVKNKINHISCEEMQVYAADVSITPVIPLQPIYISYLCNQMEVADVVRMIKSQLEACPDALSRIVEDLVNKQVKNQIFMRVINYEKNEELLKGMPHKRVFDLAIVYYIGSVEQGQSSYNINIDNNLMRYLELTAEKIEEMAYHNSMEIQRPVIRSIKDVLSEELWNLALEDAGAEEEDVKLYVLTNEEKCLGASCILYGEVLKEFAEKIKDDFYILPSSIHEVMLLPKGDNEDWQGIREMVREINEGVVDGAEVLSGEVYCYRRAEQSVVICK